MERMRMMIKNVTQADFEQEVCKRKALSWWTFRAAWCGPCRMVAPVLEEVDQELGDSLKIAKVNVDEEGELAQKYGIMSIPTLMLFKGGRVVETTVGFQPKKS